MDEIDDDLDAMWVSDCTYGYSGSGRPPSVIFFVNDDGCYEYRPVRFQLYKRKDSGWMDTTAAGLTEGAASTASTST